MMSLRLIRSAVVFFVVGVALGTYMGVNAKGAESIAPAIKR